MQTNESYHDLEADAMPQANGRYMLTVGASGPAFRDQLARSLQAQALVRVGEVLDAVDRHCVSDLVASWTRLMGVMRFDFASVPLHVGQWGTDPWARLTATLVQAMLHAESLTGRSKWLMADAAIRAFVRGHIAGLANELYGHEHLTLNDVLEDGPADPQRIAFLRSEIDRFAAFAAGVR